MHTKSISHMAHNIDRHLSRHVVTAVGGMLLIVLALSWIGDTDPSEVLKHDLQVLNTAWKQVRRVPHFSMTLQAGR